jgi:pyruvate dehydrogenase E2 component (dihydrolipoamide acetyltransferase)
MATTEFTLPELGENIAAGDVLRVLVKPGDTVSRDQPVLELETDKATIEVPSSVEGTVTEVKVKEGDKVSVGQAVLVVEDAGQAQTAGGDTGKDRAEAAPRAEQVPEPDAPERAEEGESQAESPTRGAARRPRRPAKPRRRGGVTEFVLPELGENITGGDVIRVLVTPGDAIARDQPVVELETDKATIEVPSSVEGTVIEVRVSEGEKVSVGQVVLTVEGGGAAAEEGREAGEQELAAATGESIGRVSAVEDARGDADEGAEPRADAGAEAAAAGDDDQWPEPASPDEHAGEDREPDGDRDDRYHPVSRGGLDQRVPGRRRQQQPDKPGMHEDALAEAADDAAPRRRGEVVSISRGRAAEPGASRRAAPAAPSVRRVARELGVEIHAVQGSGPGGRISADDVKAFVKRVMSQRPGAARPAAAQPAAVPGEVRLPDFARWGSVERQPMRAVRRKTAEHLSLAWQQVAHVTQHDKADITALEELRKKYAQRAEAAGGKLTVTAIAVKVLAAALKKFPQFNASIDMAAQEIVYKKYFHVGIAVDTDRGLLVPVLRDADQKSLVQISAELAQLSERARSKKTTLEEMEGGCITITNLGGIGGTSFTPIVNHPEVAILGISRSSFEPVHIEGRFEPRLLLPLSLSYDHRVIDGADAARFLRWVCEAMEQPFLLALDG